MIRSTLRRLRGRDAATEEEPDEWVMEPPRFRPATTPEDRRIIEQAYPYTMTGVDRLQALVDSVRYCEQRGISGAFVECGVWRGGSVLAMVLTLQELGVERDIYLFDTFEGMPEPSEIDRSPVDGEAALESWREAEREGERPWDHWFNPDLFNEDAVRELVLGTGYPSERVHLVRGRVEDTIPASAPDTIALLRLDTDWYESTRHELRHLYPRLSQYGVLIIDDYGHWEGSRRAVDEYFATEAAPLLLNRIDYAARVSVKH